MDKKIQIMRELENKKQYLIECGFNENNIVGIFLYGSQNYNLDTKDSDIDVLAIVIPSFKDLCLGAGTISQEIILEDNTHILIKDLNSFRLELLKQNICRIEILFTEYYLINEKYANLFYYYFQKERNNIAYINMNKGVNAVYHQAKHELKEYEKILTPKKLRNIIRLVYYLSNYIHEKELDDVIYLKNNTYIHSFLTKLTSNQLTKEEVNNAYEKVKEYLDNFNINNYQISEGRGAGLQTLNAAIPEFYSLVYFDLNPGRTKQEFYEHLTNAEEKAYKTIIAEIGAEGNITISKLVDKHRISRPVYNNLLVKIKEDNVATVANMGMKGTYIRITNPQLKLEAEQYKN